MLRVGLLLYGQPRNVEATDVFESHQRRWLSRYEVETFAHLWWSAAEVGQPYVMSSWVQGATNRPVVVNAPQILQERYRPCGLRADASRTFDFSEAARQSVSQRWSTAVPWFLDSTGNRSNILSQLSSMARVSQLALDSGRQYDYFIFARYDHVVATFPDLATLDRTAVYVSDQHPKFPDLFVGVPPSALKAMTSLATFAETALLHHTDTMWEPSAECLKFHTLRHLWPEGRILNCEAHLVRGR